MEDTATLHNDHRWFVESGVQDAEAALHSRDGRPPSAGGRSPGRDGRSDRSLNREWVDA